ncbi:hypothetical protein [Streptomyces sp. NBC_01800]|nr:hypothetical protein [Streptomyces sp. NBC_01800]WSA72980.1 hypothetical protein OIE65_42405 [Streptomyces sp. NBC_01800]
MPPRWSRRIAAYSSACCGRTVDATFHCTTRQRAYRCDGDELAEHVPLE